MNMHLLSSKRTKCIRNHDKICLYNDCYSVELKTTNKCDFRVLRPSWTPYWISRLAIICANETTDSAERFGI